jgi:acyl-coenzyme A thioesterase PaaI-like protein
VTDKKEQIARFIQREFPQTRVVVEAVGERSATVWQAVDASDLRPGGTVSGPTLMAIADVALYVAVLGEIGIVPLAVTTSLTINFLRRPAADRRVVAECRLMKVGKTRSPMWSAPTRSRRRTAAEGLAGFSAAASKRWRRIPGGAVQAARRGHCRRWKLRLK